MTKIILSIIVCSFLFAPHIEISPIYEYQDETKAVGANKCVHDGGNSATIRVISKEDSFQNGSFDLDLIIRAIDTLYIDTLSILDDSLIFSNLSDVFSPQTLYPGDSISVNIEVSYDSSIVSYYPVHVRFSVLDSSKAVSGSGEAVIYFTLYGTTEVWDIRTFMDLPRLWHPKEHPEPERVPISKVDIPISDRPNLDSILDEWQTDFQLMFVPELPYAIQMAAVHPDTLAYYAHLDSTLEIEVDSNYPVISGIRVFPKKFSGTVSGRLAIGIINDLGQEAIIHPGGVKIRLKEDDITGNAGNHTDYNETFAEGNVNEDGTFQLSYNVWQSPLEGNEIELYLEIESINSTYGIQVLQNRTLARTYKAFRNIGSTLGSNVQTDVGDWFINTDNSHPFRILHWATNVYRAVRTDVAQDAISNGIKIKLMRDASNFSHTFGNNLINLAVGRERHESVIYHEMGHFAMFEMQGGDLDCVGGDHGFFEENHFQLAWSEGWAEGFAAIMDVLYWFEDGESGQRRWEEAARGLPGVGGRELIEVTTNYAAINNGFRSELNTAGALLDLFDGPSYFNSNSPTNSFNDQGNYSGSLIDNVSLSLFQICKPLLDCRNSTVGVISSTTDYYYRLIELLKNDNCADISGVYQVFRENRYVLNTNDPNANALSSDEIGVDDVLTDWKNCAFIPIPIFMSYTLDQNSINSINQGYNLGSANTLETKWITDPLIIESDGNLWLNGNREMRWAGSGLASPQIASTLFVRICNENLTIDDGGKLEIGSSDDLNFSRAVIEPYTTITVKSGGLIKVNNGSSLTIEEHALLIFEEGALIELSGSNSVLEIKGRLELGENANFQTLGAGKVRFNMVEYPSSNKYNILTNGNNCEVTFSGKSIEVSSGTYVYPMDNLAMFSVVGSMVELGEDAFFNIGCQVTLESSVFRKIQSLSGLYVHAGIKLYGQHVDGEGRVVIRECWFKDAKYGVRAYQTPGGNSTKITGCGFSQCEKPLMIYDRGAYLYANTFEDCYRGVHSEYTTNYFNVEANVFSDIEVIGLMNISQPGSKAIVAGNVFKDIYEAMYFNRTMAYIKCNAIYRNYIAGYSENKATYNSQRSLNARFWYEQGGDNLYEEVNGLYKGNWLYFEGNSRYAFLKGYNHFKRVNNNNSVFSISASFDRPFNTAFPIDLDFTDNYWTPHMALLNPSVPNFLSLNPSGIHNPHFNINIKGTSTQPLFVYGEELTSFSGCPVTDWAGPITDKDNYTPGSIPGLLFKKLPDEGLLNHDIIYTPGRLVPSGIYQGQELGTALRAVLNGIHAGMAYDKDTVDLEELPNLGNLILNTIGPLDNLMDDDYMYNEYMSAINSAISGGLINSSNQSTYLAQIEEIIDEKLDAIAGLEYTHPSSYYSYRFTYNLDLAYLYRSFGQYSDALTQLGYLETFANERDLQLVNGFACYVTQEKGLRDSTINLFHFGEGVTACSKMLDSLYIHVMEPLDSFPGLEEDPEILSYVLSPNPTSSYLNLSLDLEVDAYIEIRIYSKTGNLLLSDIWGNRYSGIYNESYNVSSYYEDVYIFVVFADGMPFSQNFIVSLASGH